MQKDRGAMDRNATLNFRLNQFTDSHVKLRRDGKTVALRAWQPIVDAIVDGVKRRDRFDRFASLSILPTGSYYERAKVGEPDEFDLMLVMDNLELDDDPYDSGEDDGLSARDPPKGKLKALQLHAFKTFSSLQAFINQKDKKSIHLAYSLQFTPVIPRKSDSKSSWTNM